MKVPICCMRVRAPTRMQYVKDTLLLVVLLVIVARSFAQTATQLFVKPNNDTQCPSDPCLTLSQYVEQVDRYFVSNTTLQFLAGDHVLQGDSLVATQNITKFIMAGAANRRSRIVCNGATGLSFLNVSYLQVYNLSFVYCGAMLSGSEGQEGLRATLHLVNVYDFFMSSCAVENGRGYGLMGINVFNGLISDSSFHGNNHYAFSVCNNCFRSITNLECVGGNAYFRYIDSSQTGCPTVKPTYSMTVTNSSFLYGVNLGAYFTYLYQGQGRYKQLFNRGSGLAFDLTQSSYNVMITLRNVSNEHNTAVSGANLYFATTDAASESTAVQIHNSSFEHGNAEIFPGCLFRTDSGGAGIFFLFGTTFVQNDNPSFNCPTTTVFDANILNVSYSRFYNNSALYGVGICVSLIQRDVFNYTRHITIDHCTVDGNMGYYGAAADVSEIQGVLMGLHFQIRFQSTSFVFSKRLDILPRQERQDNTGILRASTVGYLEFTNCNFSYNALTALAVTGTNMIFGGSNAFLNNFGQYGGALSLKSRSAIYLLANTLMNLANNTATRLGGAIFVDDEDHCFLEIYDPTVSTHPNIHLMFTNNYAGNAGSILYGGSNIDQCTLRSRSVYVNNQTGVVFDRISDFFFNDTSTSLFSSDPTSVCFCDNTNQLDCSGYFHFTRAFPGQTFPVSAVAVGQRMGRVPAVIRADIDDTTNANIGDLEISQVAGKACSLLRYTVFSTRNVVQIFLQVQTTALIEQINGSDVINTNNIATIYHRLLPCPPAFQLSNVSGACECESRLTPYTSTCNISTQTIERNGDYWVAAQYVNITYEGLIIHQHCPFDYCRPGSDVFDLDPSDPNVQCTFNRSGLLCGACGPGLSLALGTSRCLLCPNTYLALLVPFAIAGVALVVFLLVLKLTVSIGTINGLIFFANIVADNQSTFFPPGSSNILTVFIAWLNLDLGIETCFYDGMDAYSRTWLQFVFPVYIWIIIGTLIVVSHYISTISRILGDNPISVLATLFLISYAKVLRTVYASLSYTLLNYPNGSVVPVWLYDGNIRYLRGKHIPLFIAAVLYILFIIAPFTLLLFLWQWLQAKSDSRLLSWVNSPKLKPLMDSYTAPYRDKQRYWVGMLLLIRSGLFLTFAVNTLGDPSVNLLCITIASLTIAFLAWNQGGIYKKWYLNVLESFFILQLGFLSAATYDVRARGGNQAAVIYTFVGTNLVVFTVIVIFHIFWRLSEHCGFLNVLKRQPESVSDDLERPETSNSVQRVPIKSPSKPVSVSVVELRESLLASDDS